ncbi:MAG TPA: DNA translocase FtsK 4TM domain-containing protein, partial [Acidiphilium sp.]
MSATAHARQFLSPALKARFARHTAGIAALFVVLAGLTVLISLASYHSGDPSFDTASSLPPANLAGRFGADLADALLQGFGAVAALPGLILLAWAFGLANRGGVSHWRMRLVAALIALPALAAAFGAAQAIDPRLMPGWPTPAGLGGAAGDVLGNFGVSVAHSALGVIGRGLALVSAALIGLACALYAFGFSPGEWRAAGRGAAQAARVSARQGGRAVRGARGGAGAVSAWLAPVINTPPMTDPLDPGEHAALRVPLHD